MANFKLSLPTDIPWRRICVSEDMLDPIPCDHDRPPRWRSSLAAFRYDPAEEYQPYEDEVVSYVKVVATVAAFQEDEIAVEQKHPYVPPELIDHIEQSFPCYGAVLQVSVFPTEEERPAFAVKQYPYFIDFEPKKRELYEAVTDSGEVLSGSMSSLSIGKAVTDTHSVEDYNLDLGGGGGAGLGFGLISANWDDREQTGPVSRKAREVSNVRTTDFSTERREVQSHTTQLTQMYNLFQAFHVGTNRAVFLLEPRPHIRQVAATFVNGPRALEGIQEVFLVVVRPKAMADFCISALLETAHLVPASAPKVDTVERKFHAKGSSSYDHKDGTLEKDQGHDALEYSPPPAWVIDVAGPSAGRSVKIIKRVNVAQDPAIVVSPTSFHMEGTVPWNGEYEADVTIYIKTKAKFADAIVRKLFLSARELCCCAGEESAPPGQWISYIGDLGRRWEVHSGAMSPRIFVESRQLAAAIRKEMIKSFASYRRLPHGTVRFPDSDVFYLHLAGVLHASRGGPALDAELDKTSHLDAPSVALLARALGPLTVGDLLSTDAALIGRILGRPLSEITTLKSTILQDIVTRPLNGDALI